MGNRQFKKPRCETCGLHLELCLCENLPRASTTARLTIVQHVREREKPTNTARLLAAMVESIPILIYGEREQGFLEQALAPEQGEAVYLIYPREDALTLEEVSVRHGDGIKPRFLLLDGTWHQCSRMSRRLPGLSQAECVVLPDGPPSRWQGRTQHDPRGLSTFEAGLRLLEHVDPGFVSAPMWAAFDGVNQGLVRMRTGRPASPEI